MAVEIDTKKSLDEIEGVEWGAPEYDSHLVVTCHELRKKPLDQFTVEDLRIMIGQDIGTVLLVPMALERLSDDPLISGDLFEGDLLASLARIPFAFWLKNPEQYREFQRLAQLAVERLRSDEYVAQGDWQLISQLEAATATKIEGEQGGGGQAATRAEST